MLAGVVAFALVAAVLTASVGFLSGSLPSGSTSGRGSTVLPFDLPPAEELRDPDRVVLAHYFPPLPVSLDNEDPEKDYYARNYLDPEGEGGKHAEYGGFLRDRPLPRPPLPGDDWRLQDMRREVRQAVSAGLDGFTLNILQLEDGSDPRLWRNAQLLMQAADEVDPDFGIVLMPDMSGALVEESVEDVAAAMAELAESPAAYRLEDDRLLLSPFKAEGHSAAWWEELLAEMEDVHGEEVALLPTFVGDLRRHAEDFAEISYGMSNWGARDPASNDPDRKGGDAPRALARVVTELDKRWMQPVSVQDQRPNQSYYDEAENTTNLRHTWELARVTGAELVQIPTWNDYSEGTAIAPSLMHGWTFLDLSAYFLTWYKTGEEPEIVRDAVYVTHRTQFSDAEPTFDQERLMERRGRSEPRDTVEAATFLTEPATVEVRVGDERHECDVEAGFDTCTVPLSTGEVSARVLRDGDTVARVTSPYEVTDEPEVQDLQYVGAGSLRQAAEQDADSE